MGVPSWWASSRAMLVQARSASALRCARTTTTPATKVMKSPSTWSQGIQRRRCTRGGSPT